MREKKKFFVSRFRGGDGEKGDKKGSQPKKLYLSAQPSLFLYLLNPLERLCFIVCFTFFSFCFLPTNHNLLFAYGISAWDFFLFSATYKEKEGEQKKWTHFFHSLQRSHTMLESFVVSKKWEKRKILRVFQLWYFPNSFKKHLILCGKYAINYYIWCGFNGISLLSLIM